MVVQQRPSNPSNVNKMRYFINFLLLHRKKRSHVTLLPRACGGGEGGRGRGEGGGGRGEVELVKASVGW